MRWLRYQADGHEAYGIIEGDEVVEVTGDPFAGYETTTHPAQAQPRSNSWCR